MSLKRKFWKTETNKKVTVEKMNDNYNFKIKKNEKFSF